MSIGSNIKKRRFELRMSQQDLANALGYKTRSTIAKIESGENDLTQKKLQRFAEVLDTSIEALLSRTPLSSSMPYHNDPGKNNESPQQSRNKTVAIILAGGKSYRNKQNIPNQFINILGKPVIVYCMEAYQAHAAVDDIYVVCLKGWEQIVTAYAEQYGIHKLRGLIPASSSGILSVKNGLDAIQTKYTREDIVIFQEANRPMVSIDMISKLLQACIENGSANICQKMNDYVQFLCEDNKPRYLDRNSIVSLESPEAYRIGIIMDVFLQVKKKEHPLDESCCAMLLYKLGFPINFIEGNVNNIKIVRQEDISLTTELLRHQVAGN